MVNTQMPQDFLMTATIKIIGLQVHSCCTYHSVMPENMGDHAVLYGGWPEGSLVATTNDVLVAYNKEISTYRLVQTCATQHCDQFCTQAKLMKSIFFINAIYAVKMCIHTLHHYMFSNQ